MKYILRVALVVFTIVIYSCNSASKKQTADTVAKVNLQQTNASKGSSTAKEQPVDTKVIFPGYFIILHGLQVYNDEQDPGKFEFLGDSSKTQINIVKNKIWNLTPKTDTLGVFVGNSAGNYEGTMEFVPESKADNFKVYYSFEVDIYQPDVDGIGLNEMTAYQPVKDSLSYFFRIPKSVYDNNYKLSADEIKKKLQLKDTAFKYKTSYDATPLELTEKGVVYKKKAFSIEPQSRIYLKIERYCIGKLLSTKFLTIDNSIEE